MRFAIATLIMLSACTLTHASEDKLRDLLSLLGSLKMGSSYDTVKSAVPSLGPLKPDVGPGNTEAILVTTVEEKELHGEFNFASGRLVSYGVEASALSHTAAHEFFLRCASICVELYGKGAREVILPSEHDGARDKLAIQMVWHKASILSALSLDYGASNATVGWGAQSEAPK